MSCFKLTLPMLFLAFTLSCGGGTSSSTTDPSAVAAQFKGIVSLEKTNDNAWMIKWQSVSADGIVYAVYKASEGDAFDFDSPVVTTELDFYKFKPKNIFLESHQCFLVRIANFSNDKNESKQCTTDEVLSFEGAQKIERQSDGTYLIQWPEIPVDGVVYSIYERKNQADFDFSQPSYDAIKDNFLKTQLFQQGDLYCFVVRYNHADLPADENTNEVCTEEDPPIDFAGISQLVSLSTTDVKITWLPLNNKNVIGYNIYQGSDFKELVGVSQDQTGTKTIQGLVPGRQYSFGVKTVDQYGREDLNLRILSIVMPTQ